MNNTRADAKRSSHKDQNFPTPVRVYQIRRVLDDAYEIRFENTGLIVSWLLGKSHKQMASELLNQMKEECKAINDPNLGADARYELACTFARAGDWVEANSILEPIGTGEKPEQEKLWSALQLRCEALSRVGKMEPALELATSITSVAWRALALASIRAAFLRAEMHDKGVEVQRKITLALSAVSDEKERTTVMGAIAVRYARFQLSKQATDSAKEITDWLERDKPLKSIVYEFVGENSFEAARDAAELLYLNSDEMLLKLVRVLLNRSAYLRAFQLATSFSKTFDRASAICECADHILPKCPPVERTEWVQRLLGVARDLTGWIRLYAFGRIGESVVASGDRETASAIAYEAVSIPQNVGAQIEKVSKACLEACVEAGYVDISLNLLEQRSCQKIPEIDMVRFVARLGRWDLANARLELISGLEPV